MVEEGTLREMPRYKCHKEVHALKIAALEDISGPNTEQLDASMRITPAEEGFAPFVVEHDWVERHRPAVGGYFVVYKDGYSSFSPAKAFEDGYTLDN